MLRAKLPEYVVPSAFVVLERFPLTPNGKVDRKALPRPEVQVANSSKFAPPISQMEKLLAEIWSKVLGIKQVGPHDNFFEMGGHSFLVLRVIGEINRALNARYGIFTVFG